MISLSMINFLSGFPKYVIVIILGIIIFAVAIMLIKRLFIAIILAVFLILLISIFLSIISPHEKLTVPLPDEPEPAMPTKDNLITLSRDRIIAKAGELIPLKIGIYNPLDGNITVKPTLQCPDNLSGISNIIPTIISSDQGKISSISINTTKSSTINKGQKMVCQINIKELNYSKDILIQYGG